MIAISKLLYHILFLICAVVAEKRVRESATSNHRHGNHLTKSRPRKPWVPGHVPDHPENSSFYRCLDPQQHQHHSVVAIGFHGMSRNLNLTLPSIRKRVFDVLERHSIAFDIFWFTTTTARVHHFHRREQHIPVEEIDPFQVRALHPCRFSIMDQDAVRYDDMQKFFAVRNISDSHNLTFDIWKDNYHSMRNIMGAFHTQEQLEHMIDIHMRMYKINYTAIIALRPDTAMVKDIDLPLHLKLLVKAHQSDASEAEKKIIFIPDFQHWYGLNDRAAYGSLAAMSLYLRRGIEFRDSGFYGHGEVFLKEYVEKNNITVKMSNLRVIRVRIDGTIASPDYKDAHKYMNLNDSDPDLANCVNKRAEKIRLTC